MLKNKLTKLICISLAVFTAFDLVSRSSPNVRAVSAEEESSTTEDFTYVEDIVGYTPNGGNYSKYSSYINKGYIKLNDNLNEGSGFTGTQVYLMYKPTKDRSKALRKISTMSMDGGYYDWSYSSFMESHSDGINKNVEEFSKSAQYYAGKVRSKYEPALVAKDLLDLYYVPENLDDADGTTLGDWLTHSHTDEEYKQILLYSNALISNNMMQALTLASIDSSSETWINRFIENLVNPACNYKDPDNEGEYELLRDEYGSSLTAIHQNIEKFYDGYEEGYLKLKNNESYFQNAETSIDDAVQESLENINTESQSDQSLIYLECFSLLEKYQVTNIGGLTVDMTLADIFREIAQSDLADVTYYYYAFLNSLNDGQYYSLKSTGLGNLIIYTSLNTVSISEVTDAQDKKLIEEKANLDYIRSNLSIAKQKIKDASGKERVSIYAGTNTDLLYKYCAMTETASRDNAALAEFNNLTAKDQLQENLMNALTYIGYVAMCAGMLALAAYSVAAFFFAGCSIAQLFCLGIGVFSGWVSVTVGTLFGCVIGVCAVAIVGLCVLAAIIVGIIMLVKYIIEQYEDLHAEYSSIPEVMIDKTEVDSESVYSRYDAVLNVSTGKPLDINYKRTVPAPYGTAVLKQATKWQALYVTSDSKIGAPIIVKNGTFLISGKDSSQLETTGTYPVCTFGDFAKTNLNAYLIDKKGNSVSPLYAYYYVDGDIEDPSFTNGKYLESVILRSGNSENTAREAIRIKGYTLLDENLSPNNPAATYLGYKTTNNVNQALTDIRLVWNESSESVYWGDTSNSYGFAGSTVDSLTGTDTNGIKLSLYYTKNKNLGTPILAHINNEDTDLPDPLAIYHDINEAPVGLEGINYFGGGRATNFNFWRLQPNSSWSAQKTFVFFKPSTQYTSTSHGGKIYVSGIGIFAGEKNCSDINTPLTELYDFTGFMPNKTPDGKTVEAINPNGYQMTDMDYIIPEASYTYNPYRAIYDMGVFTGQDDQPYLASNMIAHSQGYVASTIYTQGSAAWHDKDWDWSVKGYRSTRDTHTIFNNANEDINEGATGNSNWVLLPRAFYCSGPTSGRTAITAGSIYIYDNLNKIPTDLTGLNSVHELKNTYYDETNSKKQAIAKAFNVGYKRYGIPSITYGNFYMFYAAKGRVKPKYVESVYSAETNSYNQTLMTLMSKGCDYICENRIVSRLNHSNSCYEEQVWLRNENNKCIWLNIEACDDWERAYENHQDGHGFVGFKYTNTRDKAIGDIRVYSETADQYHARGSVNPADTMEFVTDAYGNKSTFTRTSDRITGEIDRYMWIYVSTDGAKITNVSIESSFDDYIKESDLAKETYTVTNHVATDQNNSLEGCYHMIITFTREEGTYIRDICYNVVYKSEVTDVAYQMMEYGFTEFKFFEVSDGYYLVIGIIRTNSRILAIKDIRFSDFDQGTNPTVGNFTYSQAQIVGDYNEEEILHIYYTKATMDENAYALKDISYKKISFFNDGELAYQFSSSIGFDMFRKSSNNYTIYDEYNEQWGFYLIRGEDDKKWGYNAPSTATASMFFDEPSLYILGIFIALTVIPVATATFIKYFKKKKG